MQPPPVVNCAVHLVLSLVYFFSLRCEGRPSPPPPTLWVVITVLHARPTALVSAPANINEAFLFQGFCTTGNSRMQGKIGFEKSKWLSLPSQREILLMLCLNHVRSISQ